ncbi:MAG: TetR family transcriptional regulator [Actinomycetota bacterium]|nr:TetR family transcriptional regulator [Actinomycetota bacterium]
MEMAPLGEAQEGRRERKKRATRLALRFAALELTSERGFAKVTVEDIADAVDVSVRTFFNYFSSKEEALVGEDPALTARLRAEVVDLPTSLSPLEAVEAALVGWLRAAHEDLESSGADHHAWKQRFSAVREQPEVRAAWAKHVAGIERTLTDALVERLGGDETLRPYAAAVAATALALLRAVGTFWGGQGGIAVLIEQTKKGFCLLRRGLPLDLADDLSLPADGPRAEAGDHHRSDDRSTRG